MERKEVKTRQISPIYVFACEKRQQLRPLTYSSACYNFYFLSFARREIRSGSRKRYSSSWGRRKNPREASLWKSSSNSTWYLPCATSCRRRMRISSSMQLLSYEEFNISVICKTRDFSFPTISRLKTDFVPRVVLQCFEILSAHREFYENQAAMIAVRAMLRLCYCINKSLKTSTLFEKLIQGASDVLVRYIFFSSSFIMKT